MADIYALPYIDIYAPTQHDRDRVCYNQRTSSMQLITAQTYSHSMRSTRPMKECTHVFWHLSFSLLVEPTSIDMQCQNFLRLGTLATHLSSVPRKALARILSRFCTTVQIKTFTYVFTIARNTFRLLYRLIL